MLSGAEGPGLESVSLELGSNFPKSRNLKALALCLSPCPGSRSFLDNGCRPILCQDGKSLGRLCLREQNPQPSSYLGIAGCRRGLCSTCMLMAVGRCFQRQGQGQSLWSQSAALGDN